MNIERTYFQTDDYHVLPEKYFFLHEYCFFLHDKLVKLLIEAEGKKLFEHTVRSKIPQKKKKEEVLGWIKQNNPTEYTKIMIKQIFPAILSDSLQFIHTALKSSDKGKLSVCYSLLRKSLKDCLYILEYMNCNKNEFIEKFENENENFFKFGNEEQRKKKKEIIAGNCKKIGFDEEWAKLVESLRYDKTLGNGFEQYFQKATHLITTQGKNISTEKANFNFIFSNSEDKISQWDNLYKFLPVLLMYFVKTAYSIFNTNISKKVKEDFTLPDFLYLKRYAKLKIKNNVVSLICDECNKKTKMTNNLIKICTEKRFWMCPSCGKIEYVLEMK